VTARDAKITQPESPNIAMSIKKQVQEDPRKRRHAREKSRRKNQPRKNQREEGRNNFYLSQNHPLVFNLFNPASSYY